MVAPPCAARPRSRLSPLVRAGGAFDVLDQSDEDDEQDLQVHLR
jgi:hypothetical protein